MGRQAEDELRDAIDCLRGFTEALTDDAGDSRVIVEAKARIRVLVGVEGWYRAQGLVAMNELVECYGAQLAAVQEMGDEAKTRLERVGCTCQNLAMAYLGHETACPVYREARA